MGFFRDRRLSRWLGLPPESGRRAPDDGADGVDEHDELHQQVTGLLARELGAQVVDTPRPVTTERIAQWFARNDFSYFVDSDGDLGGLWRGRLFYFFLFGEESEILQVRGQWNREVTIERLEEVLDACNEWNADRIWPKAYVRVRDNGMIHVITEVATDLEHGVTDDQLNQLLFCGLSTGSMFFDAIDELYPDPAGIAP
ncbi:YbjN domain-containing protein [Cellulomonas chengniuliangii]|uniref:YbjN domain-containing protein n=1 Tax=Cellulomonas chengniuliangii TaxID=2968084 RepID=A0ABY5KWV1_9CELL|nr:YbjN domain-containing protein [Cellulomonas chengniuliangii]MCC2309128.1 YbjN domain-containing protein [Cellulomonas chengniuliangii]MCC2319422.1 YbjN domain-containing protein [Cellulomonas chengniuliangii]UUI74154.1 YbjN domain-containing protein [Cellulomonas chengniuliangii]